jgi:general secretion pathway protein I
MKHKSHGFTLIEILVALSILAIVLGSSMQLFNSTIKGEQYIREKTMANWVAQNYSVQQQIDYAWPQIGTIKAETTMGGHEWLIFTNVSTTSDKNIRKLDIQVFNKKREDEVKSQLFSYIAKKQTPATRQASEQQTAPSDGGEIPEQELKEEDYLDRVNKATKNWDTDGDRNED